MFVIKDEFHKLFKNKNKNEDAIIKNFYDIAEIVAHSGNYKFSDEDIKDVIQELVIKAYKALEKFEPERMNAFTFFFNVMQRRLYDIYLKSKRRNSICKIYLSDKL